jgi:restriction system protein
MQYRPAVSRPSKRELRAESRRADAAVRLIVLGGAFALGPLFFGSSMLAKAFAALIPIGLLMLAAGGVLLWLARRGSPDASQRVLRAASRPARDWPSDRPPVDRTTVELERAALSLHRAAPERPTTWSSDVFDVIEWRRFEALVEALFRQAGFETKAESHGADQGVDVWLYSRNKPGAPVSIVQCKHWSGKRVGVDKIRELRGVMAAHDVPRGQFATTSTFTLEARAFARENGINLLDADGLMALIRKRTVEQQDALLAVALKGEYWRPTCVTCGDKMIERTPRKGGSAFWGCTNYPRCKTTMPMRAA